MAGLYIGSTQGYSGKNLLTLTLGLKLQKEGYKVGYMKPVGAVPTQVDGKLGDEDALFVQEILGLNEDPELLTPVVVDHDFKVKAFKGEYDPQHLIEKIEKAYNELSKDKDVMLVAGSGSMYSGRYCNVDGVTLVKKFGFKTIILDRFEQELHYDYLAVLKDELQDLMLGTVLNDIPEQFQEELNSMILPFLERKGITPLGVIPKDPLMGAIKIADLAKRLSGRIIVASEKADKIVENFLIGTMQVENFMTHFKKNPNVAVIVGGDRSDVQLVALEGNCQCLILTGNLYPNDIIMTRAEVLGIPIVLVREDTFSVAKKMDEILSMIKLRDVIKVNHGTKLVGSVLDFGAIKQALDLK
ncbi:MAG: DRTGG domain-containing protein [Desulfonauticus sp.]|nr:DRTGG domain-containing protein [Desulfonauticus sp.]